MDTKPFNKQLKDIQDKINKTDNKIKDISTNNEEKDLTPYTLGSVNKNALRIADLDTNADGSIRWNDSELKDPPLYVKPPTPIKGYNKHFHTQFAGGALDINALEIVEYDIVWATDVDCSKHSQQFWAKEPLIKTMQDSLLKDVPKIGGLDFIFDPDAVKWGVSALEIDIDKCYFILREKSGDNKGQIRKDSKNQEMKAKLISYNKDGTVDKTKSNIVWDEKAKCWRFYAVYAEEQEPTPTP